MHGCRRGGHRQRVFRCDWSPDEGVSVYTKPRSGCAGRKQDRMTKRRFLIAALIAIPAAAQWVHVPTPGIPRTKDGKANLSAPTPRASNGKPDVSGIWVAATGKYLANIAADGIEVPIQPWAAAIYKEHRDQNGKGHPSERCISHGLPDYDALAIPFKLIQTPGEIAVLYEAFNHYRQIFTDGRGFPENREPTWQIGRAHV